MEVLSLATFISYIALNIDIFLQNLRVWRRKSSTDVSSIGLSIRLMAIIIILLKFISLSDWALIAGQSLILINCSLYLLLVIHFRR